MKPCAACGHENDDWRPFCTRCGAPFAGPAGEPVLAPPPPWAAPPPPVPVPPGAPRDWATAGPPAMPGAFGSGAPGSGHRRSSSRLVALAAVVVILVGVGVFVGLTTLGSNRASAPTTTFPPVWDSRVTDLVQFASAQRKLDFKHPVKVVFLSEAAFKKRVTVGTSKLSAKDRLEIQHTTESLRAMGMVQGKVDLVAKMNQLRGATIAAFYDFKKKEIVIPGSKLDVAQRVTLAHELTHTLDDQHFDLGRLDKIGEKHDTDAVTALIEGDAQWVEARYIAKLTAVDRRAYARSQQTHLSPDDLDGVPKIFARFQQWPYDFGPQFITVLHEEGAESRIDAAFRSPPINEEQVVDPISFLDGDQPGSISPPVLPPGAKKLDGGKEFGVLAWYLVLSERIDAHVALRAALGWGADAFTIAREGNRTCMEVHYRGENRSDNVEMMNALGQWVAALPKGMASVKANEDDTLSLHSCDPGEAAKTVTDRSSDAYQLFVFRNQLIEEFVKVAVPPVVSTCIADAVTDQASVAGIVAGKGPAILTDRTALSRLALSCRATADAVVARDHIDK